MTDKIADARGFDENLCRTPFTKGARFLSLPACSAAATTFRGHSSSMAQGHRLASPHLYDFLPGLDVNEIEATHIGCVVDINPDPERLLYGQFKKAVDFYSMSDGRPICRHPLHLPEGSPPKIASKTRNFPIPIGRLMTSHQLCTPFPGGLETESASGRTDEPIPPLICSRRPSVLDEETSQTMHVRANLVRNCPFTFVAPPRYLGRETVAATAMSHDCSLNMNRPGLAGGSNS